MALLALSLGVCSCDGQGDEGTLCSDRTRYNGPTATLKVCLSMPGATTRVGDPGEANEEGGAWDRLVLAVAYNSVPNDGKAVRFVSLSYDEYQRLSYYSTSSTVKVFPLTLPEGTVHIYGFTYSDDATPGFTLDDVTTEAALKDMRISNSYSDDTQKFCSVATGFYVADDAQDKTQPSDFTIGSQSEATTIPVLTLTRLAAKLDIQWDAQDAYTAGLTNVQVTSFTYDGGASLTDAEEKAGYGRLFPSLSTATAQGGVKTFVNQTEISKRNGRVVHYVFPDGAKGAKVDFCITSTATASGTPSANTYTFKFPAAIQQATWYKINATIVGNSGKSSVIDTEF